MAQVGSYSVPGPSSSVTLSYEYNTIDELLVQLQDNTSNAIDADNIRNSVYSLWEYISGVQVIASQSASASTFYSNSTQIPQTIGGIVAGVSFSGTYSMQQMWDSLLYPAIPPVCGLTLSTSQREYGDSLAINLLWTVTRNNVDINLITVDATPYLGPFLTSQSGTQGASLTHSITPGLSQSNFFSVTSLDANSVTTTISKEFVWYNRRYFGWVDLGGIDPYLDLTLNPASQSLVVPVITDSVIKSGSGMNSELSDRRSKTLTGFNPNGKHLCFAFPTAFGSPTFIVNGMVNSAFTKIKSSFAFVNNSGFSGTNYDLWISNTSQNATLNIQIT